MTAWTYIGVAAFVLLAVVTLTMSYPRSFVFTHDAGVIVEWTERHGADRTWMTRDLALHLRNHFNGNRVALTWMTRGYQLAIALLLVEIVALLLDLRRI